MVIATIILLLAVAALAMVLRGGSGERDDSVAAPQTDDEGDDAGKSFLDADDDGDADETVPVSSEGIAFLHDRHEVRLVALLESEDIPDWLQKGVDSSALSHSVLDRLTARTQADPRVKPGTVLNAGDFTAVRIRPGVAGSYRWRLETLGRDGDFGFFPFEMQEGARAAVELLERQGIVAARRDEYGDPIPPSDEDFEEARRLYEESESALAMDTDDGERRDDDTWVSDRR